MKKIKIYDVEDEKQLKDAVEDAIKDVTNEFKREFRRVEVSQIKNFWKLIPTRLLK